MKKNIKKLSILAVLFTIIVTMAITVTNVEALGPSGHSYSKDTFVNSGGGSFPAYAECEHSHLNNADDESVLLGVYAYYDLNDQTPAFNYGNWEFMAQAGHSSSTSDDAPVAIRLPMVGTSCVDYGLGSQAYSNYNDYNSPTWANGYYANGQWIPLYYYASILNYQYGSYTIGDRASIEGMTQGGFYLKSNPSNTVYYYCQTQIPSGHSVPPGIQSFAFLTAHQSGDW